MIELAIAGQQRINKLMNLKSEITFPSEKVFPKHYDIELENVSYTYENTGITALKNVSMKIPTGSVIGITGKTGSGKTTLVQLILRLLDPTQGVVSIGGYLLKEYPEEELYSMISYAPQEPFLFSASIRENLLYGNFNATEEEIKEVLKATDLYDEVLNFPEGLDTLIGERGVTLSGGQKQRLSLARALLKKTPILILDDVISALDTETAEKVLTSLRKENRTLIIISHRLDIFTYCSKVFVLNNGELVEEGTHKELIERNGIYSLLWNA